MPRKSIAHRKAQNTLAAIAAVIGFMLLFAIGGNLDNELLTGTERLTESEFFALLVLACIDVAIGLGFYDFK